MATSVRHLAPSLTALVLLGYASAACDSGSTPSEPLSDTGGESGGQASSVGGTGSGGAGGGSGGSGDCEPFVMPASCAIPDGAVLPADLACTGLYADVAARELRCDVQPYTPAHELWSDGATKQRYVSLPSGGTIDVGDPNDFVYPVGTKFWKEFHVGPEGSRVLGETRLLQKTDLGWIYTTYVWDDAGSVATQTNDGVLDLFGTGHGVPSREQCKTCHSGRRDFVLGWDFLMLGEGSSGVTRESLHEAELLSGLDPSAGGPLTATIPGDAVEAAALAYLHANCGVSCHNTNPNAAGGPSGLYLRLDLDTLGSVHETTALTSGINHPPSPNAQLTDLPERSYYDFLPLDLEGSLALVRMQHRGSAAAMPPLASLQVDAAGIAAVSAWIESMTEERGYPAPAE